MDLSNLLGMLKSASYFVGVLSVLIIAHEWGHFIVAKLCKMRVDDFSLFFGPKLICLGTRNGTEYNIRSVPLGGFVKIAGMEPEDAPGAERPIFNIPQNPTFAWVQYKKLLVGLSPTSFAEVNFDNVSERTVQSVYDAIDTECSVTAGGRQNLQHLLLSTGLNKDEDLYLQAILSAAPSAPDPDGYNQKPIWQRAAVIFAGPLMSLLFGYGLFCIMGFTTGLPDNKHMAIGSVVEGKPAQLAGIQPQDWILSVNGKQVDFDDAFYMMRTSFDPSNKNRALPLNLTLIRAGKQLDVTLTPFIDKGTLIDDKGNPVKGKDGKQVIGAVTMIGITPDSAWTRYGVVSSIKEGTGIIANDVTGTVSMIFSKDVKNNVGGIISIGKTINDNSKQGPNHVLWTAALLSVSLGILNLFPIPVLDGGHLVLLLWEGVRRRRLTSREVYGAQMIGLVIIGCLFMFVMYNDVMRLIKKQ